LEKNGSIHPENSFENFNTSAARKPGRRREFSMLKLRRN
jgi:hypothetical protein